MLKFYRNSKGDHIYFKGVINPRAAGDEGNLDWARFFQPQPQPHIADQSPVTKRSRVSASCHNYFILNHEWATKTPSGSFLADQLSFGGSGFFRV
jgi:hypothetical protein